MNNTYRYPVYSVTSCPTNATKWETAARLRNCSFNEVKPINHYMCVPNQELTKLFEFCYDQIRPMVQNGKYLYGRNLFIILPKLWGWRCLVYLQASIQRSCCSSFAVLFKYVADKMQN